MESHADRHRHGALSVPWPVIAAPPTPAAMLAPGPQELDAATSELDARVAIAQAYARAVARAQTRFAEATIPAPPPDPCLDPALIGAVAQSRAFGAAWRDATQSARAQRDRLVTIASAPTVEVLLDPADRSALRARVDEVDRLARSVTEAQAWQARVADPVVARCDVRLVVGPGVVDRVPDTARGPVAIVAFGDGRVCTERGETGRPADGRPMLVADGEACWAPPGCACDPLPVGVGAVLGPPQVP